jgi:D-alanyl-D-alanine-carboxypeptidase/D-alanyl-D-alanine-endopeptidase
MRQLARWAFAFMCAGALSAGAAAQSPSNSADEQIRQAGRDWLIAHEGVGLTIGVYDNGQRIFYNFGTTQIDGNKPPTQHTVYEIGGISKTLAGQLLARSIIEGRATLEDEAAKYLPEPYPNLANGGQTVRLLHLVNSTSQLVDNIPELTQVRGVPGEPLVVTRMRVIEKYTLTEFLWQLKRVMPKLPPGSDPALSNVGSMLLGVVLENMHGEPFEKLLAREIERPLRMASGTAPASKQLARGYTADNEALPPFGARMQFAANSLRYSADDLLKYAAWQMMERDASVKLAHRPAWTAPGGQVSVGFFWILGDSPHGRRVMSTGATYGFASICDLYPEAKVAVVVLSNKSAAGAQDALRALSAKIVRLLRPVSAEDGAVISPRPSSAGAPPPGR